MIEIIPAIDIIEGKCVRLTKGDYDRQVIYRKSPVEMAKYFQDLGIERLHVVDLDGAKSKNPQNIGVLEKICNSTELNVEFGGGIKNEQALKDIFNAGAKWGIVGSIAALEPELFTDWLKIYKERLILGADIESGLVAVNGWLEKSDLTIDDLINQFIPWGVHDIICTEISKDGMLEGPDFDLYTRLQSKFPEQKIIVSGGVSSNADILKLEELGLKSVIIGKAIYENKIDLETLLW
ncbi:MAG: 1-(5-phosphoribosyl)-5-[(5-phosphoribosylamino)methylideneamino]imidazole-4-carboxamide isomerase [Bacteroidales bacterium]